MVFQPHRYTRTLNCREGFWSAFGQADRVFLTDIYSAGEPPIEGLTSGVLAMEIQDRSGSGLKVSATGDLASTEKALLAEFRPGDLILCMGAGSITRLPAQLIAHLPGDGETHGA